jgi:hypothetical protein
VGRGIMKKKVASPAFWNGEGFTKFRLESLQKAYASPIAPFSNWVPGQEERRRPHSAATERVFTRTQQGESSPTQRPHTAHPATGRTPTNISVTSLLSRQNLHPTPSPKETTLPPIQGSTKDHSRTSLSPIPEEGGAPSSLDKRAKSAPAQRPPSSSLQRITINRITKYDFLIQKRISELVRNSTKGDACTLDFSELKVSMGSPELDKIAKALKEQSIDSLTVVLPPKLSSSESFNALFLGVQHLAHINLTCQGSDQMNQLVADVIRQNLNLESVKIEYKESGQFTAESANPLVQALAECTCLKSITLSGVYPMGRDELPSLLKMVSQSSPVTHLILPTVNGLEVAQEVVNAVKKQDINIELGFDGVKFIYTEDVKEMRAPAGATISIYALDPTAGRGEKAQKITLQAADTYAL